MLGPHDDTWRPAYGVWHGQPFDNTKDTPDPHTPAIAWESVLEFDPNNPLCTWMGEAGFVVFDERVDLLDALKAYYDRARELSCGKCTPCRAGLNQIAVALDAAMADASRVALLPELLSVADLMHETSLCGVGVSSSVPFRDAVTHFMPRLLTRGSCQAQGFFGVATAPCVEACPAHVNIPRYIDYIKDGRADLATGVLLEHYPLVGTCGRVCVRPCESACLRQHVDNAVAIKDLKRFAADDVKVPLEEVFRDSPAPTLPYRVAVVGAGPAGLTCAYHLLKRGVQVDIYDDQEDAGGMARLGIPAYRLHNDFLRTETEIIKRLGGRWFFKRRLGSDIFLQDLRHDYDAVFLGLGCAKGAPLKLENVDTNPKGFYLGMDLLRELVALQEAGTPPRFEEDMIVIGCGNVAMDCCRSLRRFQYQGRMTVSYRRTRDAASADPAELVAAEDEGIEWAWLTSPVKLEVQDGQVQGLWVQPMRIEQAQEASKPKIVPSDEPLRLIPARVVVAAIGQAYDATSTEHCPELHLSKWGTIEINEHYQTSLEDVFAGGDAASGPTTLIDGMADGAAAAESMWGYLTHKKPGFVARRRLSAMMKTMDAGAQPMPQKDVCHIERAHMPHLELAQRRHTFDEVELGLSVDQAQKEASRCMRCYRVIGISTQEPIESSFYAHDSSMSVVD